MQAFRIAVTDPDTVLSPLMREIKEVGPDGKAVTKVIPAVSEEVKNSLLMNIRRRMTPQPFKIRADIEMKCFQFDGILHIKVLLISVCPFLFSSIFWIKKSHHFSFKCLFLMWVLSCFIIIWFCRRQCGRLKLLEMMTALWKLNLLLPHFMCLPLRPLTRLVQY